jgi:hypothetical protein
VGFHMSNDSKDLTYLPWPENVGCLPRVNVIYER